MCGIAGHFSIPQASPEAARKMGEALSHRGPDGAGEFSQGAIALAHRRLAIIDLATGAQPMTRGHLTVVFNGEIYNYRELRRELGGAFGTSSDTEVLLRLYEEAGLGMLPRLRGMFAFAIWDAREQRLVVARDAFGEKPLVYCEREGQLWFASEARALRAGGAPLGDLDRSALSDYLELLYIPAPRSVWTGMRKLPAGHLLVADASGVSVRRWYEPPVPGSAPERPSGNDVRERLAEAVRLRLVSDVPIAALLSGGVDSSAVVALMARELGPGVRTFAVGFGDADDELPFARLVADKFACAHSELVVGGGAAESAQAALALCGEPFGDSSIVPTLAVFREVARVSKVVLTGDGGDELFAGYDRYRLAARLPRSARGARAAALLGHVVPARHRSRLHRLSQALGSSGARRARALVEVFSLAERQALLHQDAGTSPLLELDGPEGTRDVDAALQFDLRVYLPDDLLYKVDSASMRWAVESRSPLLDTDLAALVVPPGPSSKQDRAAGKLLLKEAVADLLPPAILARKKRGFGSPVERWLKGPLAPMLADLVRAPNARIRTFLDPRAVDAVLDRSLGPRGNPHQAWALLALESWARAGR